MIKHQLLISANELSNSKICWFYVLLPSCFS